MTALKSPLAACFLLLAARPCIAQSASGDFARRVWPSEPPPDNAFAPSTEITGLAFTGRHAQYGGPTPGIRHGPQTANSIRPGRTEK